MQQKSLKLQQTQEAGSIFINEIKNMVITVVAAASVIHGDIITGKMVVEPGAVFNGTCKMGAVVKDIKIGDNGLTRAIPSQEIKSI